MPDDFDVLPTDSDAPKVTHVDANHERRAQWAYPVKQQSQSWGCFIAVLALGAALLLGFGYAHQQGWLKSEPPAKTETTAPAKTPIAGPPTDGRLGDDVLIGDYLVCVDDCIKAKLNDNGVLYAIVCGKISNATKGPVRAAKLNLFLYDQLGNRHAATKEGGQVQFDMPLNPLLNYRQYWAFIVPEGVTMERAMVELSGQSVTIDTTMGSPVWEAGRKEQERQRLSEAAKELKLQLEAEARSVNEAERREAARTASAAKAELNRQEERRKHAHELRDRQRAADVATKGLEEAEDTARIQATKARKRIEDLRVNIASLKLQLENKDRALAKLQRLVDELSTMPAGNVRHDSQLAGQLEEACRQRDGAKAKADQTRAELAQAEKDLSRAKLESTAAEAAHKRSLHDLEAQRESAKHLAELARAADAEAGGTTETLAVPKLPPAPPPQD